jgi:hypothetical protein
MTIREDPRQARGARDVRLVLRPDPELDAETCDRLTRQLRSEIAQLDVDSARLDAAGPPPEGAKAGEAVTLGAIVVAMSASGGVFATVLGTVREWLGRQSGRHRISVTIDGDTLELERATAAQQRELLDAYLRRHAVS